MAQELPKTLDMVLGNQKEWTKIELQPLMLKCVGRLTSRIFLGPRLMDDPDWQYISTEYTTDVFLAARKLNTIPPILRSVMHWFLPECRKVRGLLKQARVLIGPEVERRVEEIEKHGGPRRRVLDSVDWFVASSRAKKNSNFDIASAEISLAMASIHTTTRTIMYLLTDLLDNPGYTQDLRDECVAVMKETGVMDKSALFKMKKMDSFLRESMRLHLSGNGKKSPPPPPPGDQHLCMRLHGLTELTCANSKHDSPRHRRCQILGRHCRSQGQLHDDRPYAHDRPQPLSQPRQI